MLDIYLGKPSNYGLEYIEYNDSFFRLSEVDVDSFIQDIMYRIDGVKYAGDFKAYSKFSNKLMVFDIDDLSTGCKTAINIYSNPDIMFSIAGCGDNAIQVINNYKQGKFYLGESKSFWFFKNDISVHCGSSIKIVSDSYELEDVVDAFYECSEI